MSFPARQRGQIMLIILGTLFLGGGALTGTFVSGKSLDSMRKDVKALGLEPARKDQVLAALDRWRQVAEPTTDEVREYAATLMDLIARHDATRAEFEHVLERHRETFRESESQLLPIRDELRATLDRDEWNALLR